MCVSCPFCWSGRWHNQHPGPLIPHNTKSSFKGFEAPHPRSQKDTEPSSSLQSLRRAVRLCTPGKETFMGKHLSLKTKQELGTKTWSPALLSVSCCGPTVICVLQATCNISPSRPPLRSTGVHIPGLKCLLWLRGHWAETSVKVFEKR